MRKLNYEIPLTLNTPEFRAMWEKWLRHLRESGKRPTTDSMDLQLRQLDSMGLERAAIALEHSISSCYRTIWEPEKRVTLKGANTQSDHAAGF